MDGSRLDGSRQTSAYCNTSARGALKISLEAVADALLELEHHRLSQSDHTICDDLFGIQIR